ncbi:hypothetical protein ABPG74_013492 [Tetrahymena malaccensis]
MTFKLFEFINRIRPKPFKWLQKYLEIEKEWADFKTSIRPHRGKFILMGGVIMYPVYKPILVEGYHSMLKKISKNLDKNEPLPKIAESFGKQLITGVFQDTEVQKESGIFVQDLVKRQLVLDAVLQLLVESIKNPIFLEESKVFGKELVIDVLKDEETLKHTLNLLLKIVRDQEFKQELIETLKYTFSQPEVTEVIVELFKNAIADERCKSQLTATLGSTVNDILMDKDTLEKLKLFTYFLLESESKSQNGSIKQMIDMVVDNVMKKKQENSKENEFNRIFKEASKDLDLKQSYEDRLKDIKDRNQQNIEDLYQQFNADKNKKKFFFL